MQFREQIINELRKNPEDALRGEGLSLFDDVETAFDRGGANAIAKLFGERQSAIQTEFDANLQKLKNAM